MKDPHDEVERDAILACFCNGEVEAFEQKLKLRSPQYEWRELLAIVVSGTAEMLQQESRALKPAEVRRRIAVVHGNAVGLRDALGAEGVREALFGSHIDIDGLISRVDALRKATMLAPSEGGRPMNIATRVLAEQVFELIVERGGKPTITKSAWNAKSKRYSGLFVEMCHAVYGAACNYADVENKMTKIAWGKQLERFHKEQPMLPEGVERFPRPPRAFRRKDKN